MDKELLATYNDLIAKIAALRTEAKERAQAILEQGTASYFQKYGHIVEQLFWNQYTPWFNDGDSCEFSTSDVQLVLVDDETEEKYEEGSYFPNWVSTIKEKIAQWKEFNKDPEAYKDALEAEGFFTKWYPRDTYVPHYESLETLEKQLEQLNSYPEGFVDDTVALMTFITSIADDVLEDLFGNHVTVRITANGTQTEEYSHD